MFDYSKTNILTHKDWKGRFWDVINDVKRMPEKEAKNSGWIRSNRKDNEVFEEDPVHKLPNCGRNSKAYKRLIELKLSTVKDLRKWFLDPPLPVMCKRRENFLKDVKMRLQTFTKIIGVVEKATKGEDEFIDYRKSNNPYKARYGDEWEEKVKQSPTMKKVTNIRDMIRHMVEESEKYYEGTVYEDTWTLWHDALSLMTADATVEWMKREGYYKRWILPEHDLNTHIPYFKKPRYVAGVALKHSIIPFLTTSFLSFILKYLLLLQTAWL